MNRRIFLKYLSCTPVFNLLLQKSVQACAEWGEGVRIPLKQLPQVKQSYFDLFVNSQYPQPTPYDFSRDAKNIQIKVPDRPEGGQVVPCTVTVSTTDNNAYCRKLYVYGQCKGIWLGEKNLHHAELGNDDTVWTLLIASYVFGEQCLPYCHFHFRHIGIAMAIGVVAEMEYYDKSQAGPHYLASISHAMKDPPCYFGNLSSD